MAFESYPPTYSDTPQYIINVEAPELSGLRVTGVSLPRDGYLFYFKVSENYKVYSREQGNYGPWTLNEVHRGAIHTHLKVRPTREVSPALRPALLRMLDEVIIVPMNVQFEFIQKIEGTLVYAANRRPISLIVIEISEWSSYETRNSSDVLEAEQFRGLDLASMEDEQIMMNSTTEERQVPRGTPAARSAIESLQKVKLGDLSSDDEKLSPDSCAICLEEFLLDAELVSMPCKHLFHQECITNWLQIKKTCPVCRYKI